MNCICKKKQDIFKVKKGSVYKAFRLPALLYNNGPDNGVFLAFCEGRYGVADSSVAEIVLRRGILKEGSKKVSWGDIQVVAKKDNIRLFNPVPVLDQHMDTIIVMYRMHVKKGTDLKLTKSKDNGASWSEPKDITQEVFSKMPANVKSFTPGPGHGIQMRSGRLVVPGCVVISGEGPDFACAAVLLSDDHGESWYPGGIVPTETEDGTIVRTNESSAVELANDVICINSRTLTKGQPRAQSFSNDGGITFEKPQLVDRLTEPRNYGKSDPAGCEGAVLGFEDSANSSQPYVLFSNPNCCFIRLRMSIRLSKDGCKTWSRPWLIHCFGSGYSDLTKYQNIDNNNDTKPLLTGQYQQIDNNNDTDPSLGPKFAIVYESGFSSSCSKVTFETFDFGRVRRGIGSCLSYLCCCL